LKKKNEKKDKKDKKSKKGKKKKDKGGKELIQIKDEDVKEEEEKPLDVQELVDQGKSLGEIQLAIQERKPYFIEQKKFQEQEELKKQQILIKKLTDDPFKDPMEEIIDEFATDAEDRDKEREKAIRLEEEKKANATRDAAKKAEL